MRQIYLLLTFLLISSLGFAQLQLAKDFSDKKYLAGAVPEVDGKVVFTHVIPLGQQTPSVVFDKVYSWHEKRYKQSPSRILLSDKEKLQIASLGHVELSFKKSALYVDESDMIYQIICEIKDKNLEVTITNMKFQYSEGGKTDLHRAEDMITDKIAVKKDGKSLSRYYDKFRAHAIDAVEVIFQSIDNKLDVEGSRANNASSAVDSSPMSGYKQVGVDKLPSTLSKLLSDKLALLNVNGADILINGGSMEVVDGKSILEVSALVNFEEAEVFTVSFYTEIYRDALNGRDLSPLKTPSGGEAHSEAWMIIECKKTKKESPIYRMPFISGEIVNVWIK